MYQVEYSEKVLTHIQAAITSSPAVEEALQNLEDNPLAHSIPTGMEAIGGYYIEADKYAILFNIDAEGETITIVSVRRLAYIERLIAKRYQ